MKNKILIIVLAVLFCAALALPEPVQATKPVDDLYITAHLTIQTETYANGDFTISSPELDICDNGNAYETFLINWDEYTIHGVKTLEGDDGTIVLKFRAQMLPGNVVMGSFTIISGTGVYVNLHGVGSTTATIDAGLIDAVYEGYAHIE